jgi:N-acetylated-alpha-linked acidic dipeptidase
MPSARVAALPALLALVAADAPAPTAEPAPIRGFGAASAARQREVERRFLALPDAEQARAWHRELTRAPHPAGSARNNELAEFVAARWREQGLEDVVVHRYDVLSSMPRRVEVEMLEPVAYVPSLREDAYPEDPDTAQAEISDAWLSFSASGEVEAPVVYADSGNPADYEILRRHGIDPRGKIVVVRYSNPYSYRGFKALTAQREGAAAMIVYSDPAEDGYARGEVFPKGPWGPASHVQRGGIAFDFIVPGDPLTPGWASTAGAPRIPAEDAVSVPRIVAVPMSHRDIQPILERLGGPPAPDAWKGALPVASRQGGAEARVRVRVDMQTDVQPNLVVEGRIRGSERPDEWVVLGNHRDAWVFGGVDPSSGSAALMEVTRGLGRLKSEGVRPRRSLVFCSWDGEEVTLTGSTEWGEQFGAELRRKALAYLNVDSATSGPRLSLSATGSLAPMITELTRELRDPSGRSLFEAWSTPPPGGLGPAEGALPEQALVTTRLASGSDHTVFFGHLGLPAVEMGFDGPYGVYHSAYDSHFWVSRFADPGFRYHALMAQLWGSMALRLANADVHPFDFDAYGAALRDFVRALEAIDGAAAELDLPGLVARVRALRGAARRLAARVEAALAGGGLEAEASDRLNARLRLFEQNWLRPEGLPGRPWFRHLLYAPRYTYAAMTLPGITEAAEEKDWDRARAQAALLADALARNTVLLDAAAAELPAPDRSPLEARLRAIREGVDGRMGIYAESLATGERVAIDADSAYETFSVIKVPIMAAVLERVKQGELSLDQRVSLRRDQRRIPSGVLYALDPGLRPTLRDLLTLMTIVSDNEATDALADLVGRDAVTAFMRSLGLSETRLRFSDLAWDRLWLGQLDPGYARAAGDRTIDFPFERYPSAQVREAFRRVVEESGLYFGRSTPRELGRLFALMARGELVSKQASELMIGILKRQQVDDRFPVYLGDGVALAHKTGDGQPWVANDAGILWVKGQPVVLVVLAGHHRGSTAELHDAIARVAAEVVHHFGGEVDRAGLSPRDAAAAR